MSNGSKNDFALNETINSFVSSLTPLICTKAAELYDQDPKYIPSMLLDTYNTYQDEERDGADYIFDLRQQNDLKVLADGGLTCGEIAEVVNHCYSKNIPPLIMFGNNHPHPEYFGNPDKLKSQLIGFLPDILPYILKYPTMYPEFIDVFIGQYINLE